MFYCVICFSCCLWSFRFFFLLSFVMDLNSFRIFRLMKKMPHNKLFSIWITGFSYVCFQFTILVTENAFSCKNRSILDSLLLPMKLIFKNGTKKNNIPSKFIICELIYIVKQYICQKIKKSQWDNTSRTDHDREKSGN